MFRLDRGSYSGINAAAAERSAAGALTALIQLGVAQARDLAIKVMVQAKAAQTGWPTRWAVPTIRRRWAKVQIYTVTLWSGPNSSGSWCTERRKRERASR